MYDARLKDICAVYAGAVLDEKSLLDFLAAGTKNFGSNERKLLRELAGQKPCFIGIHPAIKHQPAFFSRCFNYRLLLVGCTDGELALE